MPSSSSLLQRCIFLLLVAGCAAPVDKLPAPVTDPPLASLQSGAATDVARSAPALEPPHAGTVEKLAPPPSLTTYTVGEGETLWLIAARTNVYADSLLWPLLYKANRDQIKDPAQIFPGQHLSIPRNVSEADKEGARDFARKSGIFPTLPVPTPHLVPAH